MAEEAYAAECRAAWHWDDLRADALDEATFLRNTPAREGRVFFDLAKWHEGEASPDESRMEVLERVAEEFGSCIVPGKDDPERLYAVVEVAAE